jgi:hypothetical protein
MANNYQQIIDKLEGKSLKPVYLLHGNEPFYVDQFVNKILDIAIPDFEKGFIRAEVIAYDDFIHYGSEAACREVGKLRVEGKEYIVKDGDCMHFRFNV